MIILGVGWGGGGVVAARNRLEHFIAVDHGRIRSVWGHPAASIPSSISIRSVIITVVATLLIPQNSVEAFFLAELYGVCSGISVCSARGPDLVWELLGNYKFITPWWPLDYGEDPLTRRT